MGIGTGGKTEGKKGDDADLVLESSARFGSWARGIVWLKFMCDANSFFRFVSIKGRLKSVSDDLGQGNIQIYSGLNLNQDKATKPQTVQIVRQGEVTPSWFKVNPL